jgi:hypothetical protein
MSADVEMDAERFRWLCDEKGLGFTYRVGSGQYGISVEKWGDWPDNLREAIDMARCARSPDDASPGTLARRIEEATSYAGRVLDSLVILVGDLERTAKLARRSTDDVMLDSPTRGIKPVTERVNDPRKRPAPTPEEAPRLHPGDPIADIRALGDKAVYAWGVATTMTHIEGERREKAVREIIDAVRASAPPRPEP